MHLLQRNHNIKLIVFDKSIILHHEWLKPIKIFAPEIVQEIFII